jgi:hypothetical protein
MPETGHPVEPEELMAYLDGELPAGRAAVAAEHLDRCAACQRMAADLRGVSRQLMAWEVTPAGAEMPRDLAAALAQRGRKPKGIGLPNWRFRRTAALGLAGACVLLVVAVRSTYRAPKPVGQVIDGHVSLGDPAGRQEQASQVQAQEPVVVDAVTRIPMIARSAQLSLTTKDFAKTRQALEEILKRHKGYIGQLNVNGPSGAGRTLDATLRVPATELDAALAELKKLGHVEQESQSGEEVTRQYVDLEARLTNARNTELRLTALLRERNGKMQDVLSVEKEITRVRGEIESMEAERKNLGARVEFATVHVTINEEYKAQLQMGPDSGWTRLGNAAVAGYRNMVEGALGAAQLLLSVGPSLILWTALLFWPARAAWRRLR